MREAAVAAGYKNTPNITTTAGHTLKRPRVLARIAHFESIQPRTVDVRDEKIIAELACIAFASLPSGTNGDVLDSLAEIPDALRPAIQEITELRSKDGGTQYRVKLYDKLRALDQLAKLKGLVRERGGQRVRVRVAFDQSGKGGVEVETG